MSADCLSRRAVAPCLCLILLGGPLAAADQPETAEEAKTLIEKGGNHWSAPKTLKSGRETFRSGGRFYVWPLEDRVFESRRGSRSVVIKLGWRLQAGQKAPMKKEFIVSLVRSLPDDGITRVEQVPLKAGVESGTFTVGVPLGKLKPGEEREAVYHLSINRKPASNLLRVKVKAGK